MTLYEHTADLMADLVTSLLILSEETSNFTEVSEVVWSNNEKSILLFCGKGYRFDGCPSPDQRQNAWLARSALPFNLETAATGVLYVKLEGFVDQMIDEAFKGTNNFNEVTAEWIHSNPHLLPILMHALGTFSKQELKKQVGSVSDTGISKPGSERLANLFININEKSVPSRDQISQRMRATTEGIVRDLVGRMLLEEFVAAALKKSKVPFTREEDYESLSGVVYDFRADFVIPDEESPKAFIEVRKSSARHASLYAKDKMFSAINWKGKHSKCLGILVIDGPWTESTLQIMSRVFDYVVPIGKVSEVSDKISEYMKGDDKVLRWLIQFNIDEA